MLTVLGVRIYCVHLAGLTFHIHTLCVCDGVCWCATVCLTATYIVYISWLTIMSCICDGINFIRVTSI